MTPPTRVRAKNSAYLMHDHTAKVLQDGKIWQNNPTKLVNLCQSRDSNVTSS
jgi:hypothetical protein